MAATPADPASCWIAPREPEALPVSAGVIPARMVENNGAITAPSPKPKARTGPASVRPDGLVPASTMTASTMTASAATAMPRPSWMTIRPPARGTRRVAASAPATLPAVAGRSIAPAPRALYPSPYWA
jgi:hypothetical protein